MKEVYQGSILHVEGCGGEIFVASTARFNQSGMVIGCPFIRNMDPAALHISAHGKEVCGVVICEQMKSLDLRSRGYSIIDEVQIKDVMEVSDALQGIFDYIL